MRETLNGGACGLRFFPEAGGLNVINPGWNPWVSETNSIATPKRVEPRIKTING